MKCPLDHETLEKALFHDVEVDYCPTCLGVWFEKDELQWAKHSKDEQLNWLDFDIWRDKGKFEVSPSDKHCPFCRAALVQVKYDNSSVKIDFCKNCQGTWLDRGEFKQILVYLKRKADYEILHHYTKNIVKQLWEVFSGPKKFREELEDFLILSKLLSYKFVIQHSLLNTLIEDLPK